MYPKAERDAAVNKGCNLFTPHHPLQNLRLGKSSVLLCFSLLNAHSLDGMASPSCSTPASSSSKLDGAPVSEISQVSEELRAMRSMAPASWLQRSGILPVHWQASCSTKLAEQALATGVGGGSVGQEARKYFLPKQHRRTIE